MLVIENFSDKSFFYQHRC